MMRDDSHELLATAVSGPLGLRTLKIVRITQSGTVTRRESWFDPELTRLLRGGPRSWLQWGRGLNAS
jgi:hypothetical protein